MELTQKGLLQKESWQAAGYDLPQFDIPAVTQRTLEAPEWVHFGAGNIFRAFQANVAQCLLNQGIMSTGLIAAEGYDYEIIEKMYRPHDNLGILVTLKADGTMEKTVVGSIVESLILDSTNAREYGRLKEIFRASSLKMAEYLCCNCCDCSTGCIHMKSGYQNHISDYIYDACNQHEKKR